MAPRNSSKNPKQQYWVVYCRKSTDDKQKQLYTLEEQDKNGREHYASLSEEERRNRPLLVLPHESKSAFKSDKRPIFKELMAMIDRGEVYGVIAVQPNRISRNPKEAGLFINYLTTFKLKRFDSAVDKRIYVGNDSNAIFMLGLECGMARKDSSDKGVLIRSAMIGHAGMGKHMGRKPFGFKPLSIVNEDQSITRKTVPDEERLPYVVGMFDRMKTGAWSLTDLENWLKKNKVKTRETSEDNPSHYLNASSIAHILHDPYYKGYVRYLKKETKWAEPHEAPVHPDVWNQVQIVLNNRNKGTSRVKNDELREAFLFCSEIKCGKCGHVMSPYRVLKKTGKVYFYYECKNRLTKCGSTISQEALKEEHRKGLAQIHLGAKELEAIRGKLLELHKEKSQGAHKEREALQQKYLQISQKITDQLSNLPIAQKIGVAKEAEDNISALRSDRDALQMKMNRMHEEGTDWIEKTIKNFELLRLTEEMLQYGSPQVREATLKAIGSNYRILDGKLVCDLKSPFKEAFGRDDRTEWWAILDSNQ